MRRRLDIVICLLIVIIILMVTSMLTSCDGVKGLHRENYNRNNGVKVEQMRDIQNHYIR